MFADSNCLTEAVFAIQSKGLDVKDLRQQSARATETYKVVCVALHASCCHSHDGTTNHSPRTIPFRPNTMLQTTSSLHGLATSHCTAPPSQVTVSEFPLAHPFFTCYLLQYKGNTTFQDTMPDQHAPAILTSLPALHAEIIAHAMFTGPAESSRSMMLLLRN
jgi:hypothetical protein